ncbi:alpha/beta hydrolase [Marilutibacter maris]|uniref:BD-FAE-like domain-containing protein n=1 Tax=Marilutibacter maris TaxID=1605891 RepID=A0A2U9T4Y9_9GAMM|nr:alpha/beta hydrolase [Lysobacter maris]AWV07816.1 hypothetical protein C9I47_2133 [Lysobacter maris]
MKPIRSPRSGVLALTLAALLLHTAPPARGSDPGGAATAAPALPDGTRVLRDIAYGHDRRQRFDVYVPADARDAAVIFLVHGGGWAVGDKAHRNLMANKLAYWLPRGFVVISSNYRLLPDAGPLEQAGDIARAVAHAQRLARSWSADADAFVLMGHSAGAHLVALLGADPALLAAAGARRPRGAVSLDSAAMDVVEMMQAPRHPRLYDRAFGRVAADWRAASPRHRLSPDALPMLIVCSSRRIDACPSGRALARDAVALGVSMRVLPQPLSHRDINRELGLAGAYTEAVDAFIRACLPVPQPARRPETNDPAEAGPSG